MSAITLQINICPGDIAYAHLTVPRLVKMYREVCAEVLAIVDCCPPQVTQFVNTTRRFPPTEFAERVKKLEAMVAVWQCENLLDRVVYLRPGSDRFQSLSQKYLQGIVRETHDGYGHALMSYLAALDAPQTQYVLHFDADILMYCAPGAKWLEEACDCLQANPVLLAVSPRICPPPVSKDSINEATPATPDHPESGWLSTWKAQPVEGGWLSDWISTRCFLLDRERLQQMGHLIADYEVSRSRNHARIHQLGRKLVGGLWLGSLGDLPQPHVGDSLTRRVRNVLKYRILPLYPQPPEVMLHNRLREQEWQCLYLSREDAWYVHPTTKPKLFLDLLPNLLKAINDNSFPFEQWRFSEIRLSAWQDYFSKQALLEESSVEIISERFTCP